MIYIDRNQEATREQLEALLFRMVIEIAIKLGLTNRIEKQCRDLDIPFGKED
jgi:hypothetical protein